MLRQGCAVERKAIAGLATVPPFCLASGELVDVVRWRRRPSRTSWWSSRRPFEAFSKSIILRRTESPGMNGWQKLGGRAVALNVRLWVIHLAAAGRLITRRRTIFHVRSFRTRLDDETNRFAFAPPPPTVCLQECPKHEARWSLTMRWPAWIQFQRM
jgi:hypothetical protein